MGKTTLLCAIAAKMMPIPKGIDSYFVRHPVDPSAASALEAVLEVDEERHELEAEAEWLEDLLTAENATMEDQAEVSERLNEVYERLEQMGASSAPAKAMNILAGLGFTPDMQKKATSDFSGGWRMRISLARALFVNPTMLILDGPTAHLDMEAVVWLETYLAKFQGVLLFVSHSTDFMDNVATQTILMRQQKLWNFGGNYSTYMRTREEKETSQQKQYVREQEQIQDLKDFVAKFGHGTAKLARQAKSREKLLNHVVEAGLTEAVTFDRPLKIVFPNAGKLPPPVLQLQGVTFAYPNGRTIFQNEDFGADMDSRICLVGPNGAGKSTLLKLISGELVPTDGMVRRHHHLRMAKFSQHSADQLPADLTPIEFMLREYPKDAEGTATGIETARAMVGRFGVTGPAQNQKIGTLSDGQKARLAFAWIAEKKPNFILMDECARRFRRRAAEGRGGAARLGSARSD